MRQLSASTWNCVHSFGPQRATGEPGSSAIRCWNIAAAGAISSATRSGSTGVDQSRSVEPFHCEVLAFS